MRGTKFLLITAYFCDVSKYCDLISSPDFRLSVIVLSSDLTPSSIDVSAMISRCFLTAPYYDSISLNTAANKFNSGFIKHFKFYEKLIVCESHYLSSQRG